ncbi:MAG: type II toxin-antitoxin system HicB family antitoxin [Candidatus Brocadia sp.]|nr:MAG: type II toxin-antitoxin system HicB family antitoxin [Candidatus Brocadia sp.]
MLPEYLIPITIEPLEEGGYLATSQTIQGLVAQGRTIAETLKIAQDVARKIVMSCIEYHDPLPMQVS